MSRKIRLAVIVSHPIPYYTPYYRALVKHGALNVRVFFASKIGLEKTLDPGMGAELAWNTDLLSGYEHVFLREAASIKGTTFSEVNNPSISAALDEFAPNVVVLHGYAQMTMLRGLAWCLRNSIPMLMTSDSSLHSGTSWPARILKNALLPIVLRQFGAFLSVGDANQAYLENFGVPRTRIFRVPNVVDDGFWSYRDKRGEERARVRSILGLDDADLLVLFVGKLIGRKRPGDLLGALALLRLMPASPRRITVLFAGDGALRSALKQEAEAQALRAHFLGFVNIDSLPAYYCAADILAHPAEIETFGVIVLEAAILGLPLVLSDRVGAIGPTSIARVGENALVYPCADIRALAQVLNLLACEPDRLTQMAAASLRFSQELDWRNAVSGTLAAIDYCLRDSGAIPERHAHRADSIPGV